MKKEQEMCNENDVPMIELHKVDTTMAYAARIVHDVKVIVGICIAAIFLISVSIVLIFTLIGMGLSDLETTDSVLELLENGLLSSVLFFFVAAARTPITIR